MDVDQDDDVALIDGLLYLATSHTNPAGIPSTNPLSESRRADIPHSMCLHPVIPKAEQSAGEGDQHTESTQPRNRRSSNPWGDKQEYDGKPMTGGDLHILPGSAAHIVLPDTSAGTKMLAQQSPMTSDHIGQDPPKVAITSCALECLKRS
ncbi:hypothetical protein PIB30_072205 [Stylosanthes scabra]|uniref:Uncharacterized protein n=1 Tax=Stylosanthes scabra TaxID=79078 RepID=A0ABU6SP45_9FABA|nr:hypothetical protein [Stylosanthes scabra]